ncbi:MAG: hypothetical protein ACKVH8_08545 [Pirellulales bacterium]
MPAEEKNKFDLERTKLMHDHTKHISTVSIACIMVIVTFLSSFREFDLEGILLVVLAIVCLSVSVICVGVTQLVNIGVFRARFQGEDDKQSTNKMMRFYIGPHWSLIIGIIFLAMFAVFNLGI